MGGKERILFVDDEVMIIEMVEAMLPSIGYQVSCFQSGADALAELRRNNHHYDLVITNLTMPRMNGDQLAEAVQSIQPDLPVIIITGFSNRLSEQRLAELNIHAVLHKPLLRADLDAAIRNALSQGKPDQRLTAQE
ncbi:MAG: response regulator [Alphaproteobacteria bacterium]